MSFPPSSAHVRVHVSEHLSGSSLTAVNQVSVGSLEQQALGREERVLANHRIQKVNRK